MEDLCLRENCISVTALEMLGGDFKVLGFLWVLRDVMGGKNEAVINLKGLAESLGVTMQKIYGFIGLLEDSFIIETHAEPEGRRIKILIDSVVQEAGYSSEECTDFIMNYLTSRNIIPGISSNGQTNTVTMNTAMFMGNNFTLIKSFYSALTLTLNDRRQLEYSMNDAGIELCDGGRVVSFANGLKNAGFLSSYSYSKSPKRIITAEIADTPEAHRFISGVWLEFWAHGRAVSVIAGAYSCVRNLHVTLPENEQFEFDILICAGKNIFWIEAKTAKYSAYLPKYSRIADMLGLPPAYVFLVAPDAPTCEIMQGVTCCNLEGFTQAFGDSLKACM